MIDVNVSKGAPSEPGFYLMTLTGECWTAVEVWEHSGGLEISSYSHKFDGGVEDAENYTFAGPIVPPDIPEEVDLPEFDNGGMKVVCPDGSE